MGSARLSLVLWVVWICLFHSLFFVGGGVGHALLLLRFWNRQWHEIVSSYFFLSQKQDFTESDWTRSFFASLPLSDILILFFIFSWNQLQVQPRWQFLMLRMPSISLPSLPSFRRWHVLLLMGLMATTMLQGCGCVDTRLQTKKKKVVQLVKL